MATATASAISLARSLAACLALHVNGTGVQFPPEDSSHLEQD